MINKGERQELRSIVRQQFKVLRSEVAQRELEMYADVENQIAAKYAETDSEWAVLMHEVHEATMEANRRINDALYNAGFQTKGRTERMWIEVRPIQQPKEERVNLRTIATARIRAQCRAALLRLERDEADLLRTLAIGAIESEEARGFLERIPTVGELVSVASLAELEASFTDEEQP